MLPLPVCRWRGEGRQDRFVCHSARYVGAPNLVGAAFCRQCGRADHVPPPPVPPGAALRPPGRATGQRRERRQVVGSLRLYRPRQLHTRLDGRGPRRGSLLHPLCRLPARRPVRAELHADAAACRRFPGRRSGLSSGALLGSRRRSRWRRRALFRLGVHHRSRSSPRRLPTTDSGLVSGPPGRDAPGPPDLLLTPYDVDCVDADAVHPAAAQPTTRSERNWELKVFASFAQPLPRSALPRRRLLSLPQPRVPL